jgi:hypothetical protein
MRYVSIINVCLFIIEISISKIKSEYFSITKSMKELKSNNQFLKNTIIK